MSDELKIRLGSELSQDLGDFIKAWKRGEEGDFRQQRIVAFESWAALASILTTQRYRLLRHVRGHPARSVNALAGELKRQYRRVHEDVAALERVGLIDRSKGDVRATADRLTAEVVL
jgi:predicted transcriptional regulator